MIFKRRNNLTDFFLLIFLTISYSIVLGIHLVQGVYFLQLQYHLQASAGEASLALGLAIAANFLGGPIYGILYALLGYRRSVVAGCIVCSGGYMLVSIAGSIQLVQVIMPLLIGTGTGLVHMSSYSIIGKAFTAKRAFANSVVSGGARVGAMFFGPLVQTMVETYSWRWSLRYNGAIILHSIPAGMLAHWFLIPASNQETKSGGEEMGADSEKISMKDEGVTQVADQNGHKKTTQSKSLRKPKCSKTLLNYSLLRDPILICCLSGMSLGLTASLGQGLYLVRYAQDIGIEDNKAVWLLSVCRAIYTVSCPVIGLAVSYCRSGLDTDEDEPPDAIDSSTKARSRSFQCLSFCRRIRRTYVLVLALVSVAISLTIPLIFESYHGFLAYAICLGVTSGPISSLCVTVIADLFGAENLPSTLSYRSFSAGILFMCVPPFIGHMVDLVGNYRPAHYISIILALAGAALTLLTQLMINRRRKGRNIGMVDEGIK